MADRIRPDWIAVDWGTTALRATAVAGDRIVPLGSRPWGMNALRPGEWEDALLALLGERIDLAGPVEILACGMAGARQGWVEAPYRPVPCPPLGPGLTRAPTRRPGLSVRIVPGLSQSDPPEVMRGEETQVAGFLALHPGWDGVLVLPGTHCKWVAVSAGEVTGFRTAMTGEMFGLLSAGSVLRHSLPAEAAADPARPAFLDGVDAGMAAPDQLLARLFRIRARDLLGTQDPTDAAAHLSGLLIGAELAAMRGWWLGARVGLVCSGPLAAAYAAALGRQGVRVERAEAEPATLAGLALARRLT